MLHAIGTPCKADDTESPALFSAHITPSKPHLLDLPNSKVKPPTLFRNSGSYNLNLTITRRVVFLEKTIGDKVGKNSKHASLRQHVK